MFIDPALDEIVREVTPSDAEFRRATDRADFYGSVLTRDRSMEASGYLIGGSCGKRTALSPIDDVDVFIIMEPDAFARSDGGRLQPATVLKTFQERLDVTIRSKAGATTRPQPHSVRIVLTGERSNHVDVVPAFPVKRDIIEVPERGSRQWIRTSIVRQQALLDELDPPSRAVRRAIRLTKYWRDRHCVDICSYALEVLILIAAAQGLARHPSKLLIAALRSLGDGELRSPLVLEHFWKPRGDLHGGIYDPAVPNNNLTDYLSAAGRRKVCSRARRSAEALERACTYADEGQPGRAYDRVRAAFGEDD